MKRALVIGIDDYPASPLRGCVNDATAVSRLLEANGDGSPNFSVRTLTSNDADVGNAALQLAVSELFKGGNAETALLYFAGHGIINPETNAGYIVGSDGRRGAWGMSLAEILGLANDAHPRIRSTVIILDCCHSGYAGEVAGLPVGSPSVIGTGVTILTACHREGTAEDGQRHGVFTDILLDGLQGGCSDIRGNITPAALYSHVDQTLGAWEQRPIYKANVQSFVTLRQVEPKIPFDVLRRLPTYFPEPATVFALDPSFEPDRENIPEEFRSIPVNEDNVRVFKELQKCNRHGLVVPVDAEHMYYAAIESKGCRLTALGAHYRKLAEMKRL
ncbi:caspase family protein [Cupriavidus consociatus]|uniref:caspase family protein n=1 Tax=Cupriavidus consociatus TaxID=2821357 RepID=UPI001AE78E57|nr:MULTISPECIES: caspase family protein [unclassified Cupriavidus]MBP0622933.1 caspase family protein [Cupriavidus sp. LEh25]MDK2659621.1 caspase family protein [Cupriavidus sp. LEh21]